MSNLPYPNVNPLVHQTLFWQGASGARYEFYNYAVGTTFLQLPGVYIFSTWREGLFYSIYVGETEDFSNRLNNLIEHHRWESIRNAGATHIGALTVYGGLSERLRIETDLRHGLNPPCNRQ